MVKDFKFVDGLDPDRTEDRAVAFAERRSHAAKHGHQFRRKAGSKRIPKHTHPSLLPFVRPSRQDKDEVNTTVTKRVRATSELLPATGSALGSPKPLPHIIFSDSIFDRRSFAFWLARTKRFTSRDGARDDVLEWIIPQYAWSSSSVHHMLIAHSIFHELATTPRELHDTTGKARAVRHYVAGLHYMRGPHTTLVEILLSSYLAWIVEGLQNQDETAAVHVKGWKSLLRNMNASRHERGNQMRDKDADLVEHNVAPVLNRAEGIYTLTMACMKPHPRTDARDGEQLVSPPKMAAFSTSEEARHEIVRIILRIHEASVQDNVQTVLGELRLELRRWIRNDFYWNDIDVNPISRGAIVLLFDIAAAMLPVEVAVGMSCAGDDTIVPGILSRAHFLLNSSSNMSVQKRAEVLATLRLVAGLCLKIWDDQGYAEGCYGLLRAIETQKS